MNCGWPPFRMTERSVELSIADEWINNHSDIIEIGAVTPYYWPGRIKNIVDPSDEHVLVNHRKSLFDVELSDKSVLSISTLEHVGKAEYGLKEERHLAVSAFEKITSEAKDFLITIPVGWNKYLDNYIIPLKDTKDYEIFFLCRDRGSKANNWKQFEKLSGGQLSYGDYANSLIIIIS